MLMFSEASRVTCEKEAQEFELAGFEIWNTATRSNRTTQSTIDSHDTTQRVNQGPISATVMVNNSGLSYYQQIELRSFIPESQSDSAKRYAPIWTFGAGCDHLSL